MSASILTSVDAGDALTLHDAMRKGLNLLNLAAILMIAGCSAGRIDHAQSDGAATANDVRAVAGSDLPTVIRGDPFALRLARESLESILREMIAGANAGRPIRFVAGPEGALPSGLRLILAFNPPVATSDRGLCATASPPGGPPSLDGKVELKAAFCSGKEAVSSLSGSVEDVTGLDDPRFRSFLRAAVHRLFPIQDPEDRPDGNEQVPPVGP